MNKIACSRVFKMKNEKKIQKTRKKTNKLQWIKIKKCVWFHENLLFQIWKIFIFSLVSYSERWVESSRVRCFDMHVLRDAPSRCENDHHSGYKFGYSSRLSPGHDLHLQGLKQLSIEWHTQQYICKRIVRCWSEIEISVDFCKMYKHF